MRTSRRLIDCVLIKGRLADQQGNALPGSVKYWIPGQHRGKVIRVGPSGKYKIKIHGYPANKVVRLISYSPGYQDLHSTTHLKSYVFQIHTAMGYKIVGYGNQYMKPCSRPWIWFTMYPNTVT